MAKPKQSKVYKYLDRITFSKVGKYTLCQKSLHNYIYLRVLFISTHKKDKNLILKFLSKLKPGQLKIARVHKNKIKTLSLCMASRGFFS